MRSLRFPEARSRSSAFAALAFLLVLGGAHSTLAQPKPAPSPAATSRPAAPSPGSSAAPATAQSGGPRPAGPRPQVPGKPAASGSAAASSAAPPEPIEGDDQVQKLYAEGYDAFQRGAFVEAEAALTKAWALSKSFDVAGALGSAKLEVGKHREAAQYLSFALRNALPSTRASVRDRIKRDLDSAKKHLATVKLTASLAEAKITVDGAGIDPLFFGPEIFVDPGSHKFEATADGYTPATSTVAMKAGEIYVVALTLERTSATKGGGVPAPTVEQSTPVPAAVLGGAGGVAIIVGAVLIGAAEASKTNAYDLARNTLTPDGNPTCPQKGPGPTEQCDKVRSAAANADIFGNAGIGVFIGAGALLAGATAYMLFLRPPPPAAAPAKAEGATSRILPAVGPNGGGLIWQGSF